ncbi:hypothetical protein FIA58_004585 [Flavobacterium jejuense]|uniref:Uncharacterized protein n=1 Tax=Flavobacterium jejuense TaxID=1544455 RepID=A0ABX0IMX4_9FLAO|nr:hypothetical protein [Flavobacterium jejuense]NHN24948.1 hypothetical protein [Flavobacterium jejuense]
MKSFLVVLLFSVVSVASFGQEITDLENYPLKSIDDYKKAEPKVVECVDYLFSTPVSKEDKNRLEANKFIILWMTGTDYTFSVDTKATELTEGNDALFTMYMAGMAKVVLESETKLSDDVIHNKVRDMLVAYCKEESNNCKPTRKLRKWMK